jgi:pimeloyl-ACP methyl ester carboxylesterase
MGLNEIDRRLHAAMKRLLAVGGSRASSVGPGSAGVHHLEEGTGRPVVLLHGGTGGGANWFRLLRPLSDGFRVLAPDLPGFGLSPSIRPSRPLGVAAAEVLHLWLREHDVRAAVVVGTSFGGLAALRLAQRSPSRVSGLLLLDSAGLDTGVHPLIRLAALPGLTRMATRPSRRGTDLLFRTLLTSNRSELAGEARLALVEWLYASATATGTRYLAETLRAFVSVRGQREVVGPAELAALPQPVSLVWGERDPFLPAAHAHAAARHCRDARTVIVPGVGHSPNWESPAAVLDAIRELAARSTA